MENPCKKHVEEKVYSFQPISSTDKCKKSSNLNTPKQIDCKKFGGLFGKDGPGPLLVMAPPPYTDLGKRARDVFGRGYHFGLIKLDCKTSTASGVNFSTGGTSDQESGKVTGQLESKYTVKDYGITFTEKWNTNNSLGTEIEVKDQGLQGLKLAAALNFSPQEGYQSGLLKTAFVNDRVALNADVDLNANNQIIKGAAVIGHQGWLAGYQGAWDVQNGKLSKNNFALGFSTSDFVLHTAVERNDDEETENSDDGQTFSGSIYQKLSPKVETAINLSWATSGEKTVFGLGCKYELDQDAALRAKVNNESQIGLGYQQRLRDGVTLTLSTLIDGKNFNQGGHKIGLALELEA